MRKTEAVIYSLIGPGCKNIRPLACTVDIAADMLFNQGIAIDDIQVINQIYPKVAKMLGKSDASVVRSIERMANRCWERASPKQLEEIIGKQLHDIHAPRDMIFYLAFYIHLETPFYTAIERSPSLLF